MISLQTLPEFGLQQRKEIGMCVFCAAVPAALAVGAHANARQKRSSSPAQPEVGNPHRLNVDARAATAVVVAGLLIASGIYHSQTGG